MEHLRSMWKTAAEDGWFYHGTADRFVDSILANGLLPGRDGKVNAWRTKDKAVTNFLGYTNARLLRFRARPATQGLLGPDHMLVDGPIPPEEIELLPDRFREDWWNMKREAGRRTTIWRGMGRLSGSPDEVIARLAETGLGVHWSTERWVASYWTKGSGWLLIEAILPRAGIETDPAVLDALDVQGDGGWEQEVTLRPGTPIEVVRFSGSMWTRPGGRFFA